MGFAVLVTGFGLAQLVVRMRATGWRPGRSWVPPLVAVLLPPLAGLATWPTIGTEPENGTRTVAVVQGNAPDVGIELIGRRDTIRANHLAESAELLERIRSGELPPPDFVVWPETATDVRGDDPQLDALVDDFGVPALIGALYQPPGSELTENATLVWQPGDSPTGITDHYVKRELVPFAEYVPMRDIARWFTPFVDNTRDMRWGDEATLLDVGGTPVGSVICYEIAYDYVVRDTVEVGAQLIVTSTNNAWYGPGEMSHQQLAMSRLRAVEHGRAVVVAATSGISAIVAPDGAAHPFHQPLHRHLPGRRRPPARRGYAVGSTRCVDRVRAGRGRARRHGRRVRAPVAHEEDRNASRRDRRGAAWRRGHSTRMTSTRCW